MISNKIAAQFFVMTSAIMLLGGCRGVDNRQEASGTVSVDGRPLARGSISFMPVEGNNATSAGALIEDGRFEVPAAQGLMPGKYNVLIQAWKETDEIINDPYAGPMKRMVPIAFKETGSLEIIAVAEGKNRFHFKLTSIP